MGSKSVLREEEAKKKSKKKKKNAKQKKESSRKIRRIFDAFRERSLRCPTTVQSRASKMPFTWKKRIGTLLEEEEANAGCIYMWGEKAEGAAPLERVWVKFAELTNQILQLWVSAFSRIEIQKIRQFISTCQCR